jgi:Tfp pilus assembly protein PilP
VRKKLLYFLGMLLVCLSLGLSLMQLQSTQAQSEGDGSSNAGSVQNPQQGTEGPQVEAVDPEVQAILEKEAEMIRKMNESESSQNEGTQGTGGIPGAPSETVTSGSGDSLGATAPGAPTSAASAPDSGSHQTEAVGSSVDPGQGGETPEEVMTEANKKLPIGLDQFRLEYELGYNPTQYRDPFSVPLSLQGKDPRTILETTIEETSESSEQEDTSVVTSNPYLAHYVKEYIISGILWGVKKPRAMVVAPSGQLLSIQTGMRLGREGGVVWAIREKEVVFLMPDRQGDLRKGTPLILRMRK